MKSEYIGAVQHVWYGHTNVPHDSDFEFAWKAVKAIVAGDGVISEAERLHLVGKMCAILTPQDVVERVMSWDERSEAPAALLAQVGVPPQIRRATGAWIVYEGLSAALADGELEPGELAVVHKVAQTLEVPSETVDALHEIVVAESKLRQRRIEALHGTISEKFRFER